jgi:oligopeptide transport system substrate-binding protein
MSIVRRLVLPAGIAGALMLTLSGCSTREERVAATVRAGVLDFGNGAEPEDLDPQITTGVPEHQLQLALFEGLVGQDPVNLDPIPGVAESWDISRDRRVYTFHLRADAKWSNGAPITADDFVRSYQRMLTPSLAAEYAYMIYDYVEGAKEYYDGTIKDFADVGFRAIDPHTLEIHLKAPTPFFLKLIAHNSWYPVPVDVIARFGGLDRKGTDWTRPENFVGNGAFKLKEWLPKQLIEVEKSDTYWDRANVKLNGIRFYSVENSGTEERMYRTGQLQRINVLPLAKVDTYRDAGDPALRIEPLLSAYFYRLNTTRPPLNDVRVRRALALAIDRESIVKNVLRAGQAPAYHFTPPGVPGYEVSANLHPSVEEAQRLLAEAGFPGGKGFPHLNLLFNTLESHRTIAEAIQQMWRTNLGIEITLANKEWGVYLDAQDSLDYDISRSGWQADYVDPHTFLEIFVTNGGNNDTGWSNAEYDALLQQALNAPDDTTRFAIYNRMEQILIDEMPIIPIYHYKRVYLLDPIVKGWYPTPLDIHPFKFIHLETPAAP